METCSIPNFKHRNTHSLVLPCTYSIYSGDLIHCQSSMPGIQGLNDWEKQKF